MPLGPFGLSGVNLTFTEIYNAIITRQLGAEDNCNFNDSHIKKAIKCQYLNMMLSILSEAKPSQTKV